MTRVAAVVLAAGQGRRLGGRPKAGLTLADGRTFVAAVVDAARAGGCGRILAVVAPGGEAALRAAAPVDDVLVNPDPARGMASSAAVGLAALDPAAWDAALVWPVDHPLVAPATVARLVGAARRDGVVVPRRGGRGGHPTAFGAALWPACLAAAGAEGGLRRVLAEAAPRVIALAVDDEGVVRDVDTPEEYARIGGSGPDREPSRPRPRREP